MNWEDELRTLGIFRVAKKRNSPLRKKLSIIKRLKNIGPEEVESIKSDLASEDMSKFTSEMVSSLLLGRVQSGDDIKNVVRVTSALVVCNDFVKQLMSELGKAIRRGIHDIEKYWLPAYFFDMQILIQRTAGRDEGKGGLIRDLCNKIDERPRILFLAYLAENHKDEASRVEIGNQSRKIGSLAIDDSSDRLAVAGRSLGIEVRDRGGGFNKIIGVEDEEFRYYTGRTGSLECYDGGLDVREIRSYIIRHSGDAEKLDALSKSIRNANGQREIVSILMQLKLNPNLITSIARILKNMGAVAKKVVTALFKEIYQARNTSHNDVLSNCLLISEMCKFREVSPDEIFALLDHFFKTKNIEAYCVCLNGVGRYFLSNEATSHRIRGSIERIRNCRSSRMDSIYISNCLSSLFSPSQVALCADYRGFFRYFFRKGTFDRNSFLWSCLIRSKATLISMFLHPWVFEDTDFVASLVHLAGVSEHMMKMIVPTIEIMHRHSKYRCVALVRLYSSLLQFESRDSWTHIIDSAFQLEADNVFKCKVVMMLLQKMPVDVQRQYVPAIRAYISEEESLDLRILFFNFCESIGVEASNVGYDDSFDEELDFIRSYA
ncbi:hypothetical protein J0A71_10g22110 [Encephalitozoon cuniculi]|nr:hypothetical protein J0A71_10g22110 [Encephalitozoon cuniculi]